MTNLEISKALALAIGYPRSYVNVLGEPKQVWVQTLKGYAWSIRVFDYRDWNVIGPIAERYNLFPYKASDGLWFVQNPALFELTDTPQKAIALAVIGAKT
jgi:hypothetical protein